MHVNRNEKLSELVVCLLCCQLQSSAVNNGGGSGVVISMYSLLLRLFTGPS